MPKIQLELQQSIKNAIGYTDKTEVCAQCKFFTTISPSDGYEDVCKLHESTIGLMNVKPEGRCNFHASVG